MDQMDVIHPASIGNEEILADLLKRLGFASRPISKQTSDAKIRHRDTRPNPPPQRLLSWEDNAGFESYVVVATERGALCIYYYQEENDLFILWEEFRGAVEPRQISESIHSAATRIEVAIRFYYFWPERIQTSQDLDLILTSIGFQSHEVVWPEGLPSFGESRAAPHRLIVGSEHRLGTDALVSVEKTIAYVYCLDQSTGSYRQWVKLRGEYDYAGIAEWANTLSEQTRKSVMASAMPYVKNGVLYEAVFSAMRGKQERKDF